MLAVRIGLLANLLWYLRRSQNLFSMAQEGYRPAQHSVKREGYQAETRETRDDDSIRWIDRVLESGARPSLNCGVPIKEIPAGKSIRLTYLRHSVQDFLFAPY